MDTLANELTSERGNLVIQKVKFEDGFDLLQALANGSYALVLAEGLPKAHGLGMWIVDLSQRVRYGTDTLPSELIPEVKLKAL
jgi:hypothetical protein